ncbi:MAG: NTP transferase domain-containing protein [Bdellovibrionales bacterium]|nr:NTP transferase domain-containing protein [Bdellovibrionales bacterium]
MSDKISPKDVPIFILAGGLGTRLSEETGSKPKPMVEIGEYPILLHLMRYYYRFGFNDFVICAGYKAWEIKKYFLDYQFRERDFAIDHRKSLGEGPQGLGQSTVQENWRVTVLDTGLESMTGARVARAYDRVYPERKFEHFGLTYGDGLCDVDLAKELGFHLEQNRTGTVLAVHPLARFGELETDGKSQVLEFSEKPQSKQGLINGGFFFFKSGFRKYLSDGAETILEKAPLVNLAKDGQLAFYKHEGFWHPMDTLRDKQHLESLYASKKAPWIGK